MTLNAYLHLVKFGPQLLYQCLIILATPHCADPGDEVEIILELT